MIEKIVIKGLSDTLEIGATMAEMQAAISKFTSTLIDSGAAGVFVTVIFNDKEQNAMGSIAAVASPEIIRPLVLVEATEQLERICSAAMLDAAVPEKCKGS